MLTVFRDRAIRWVLLATLGYGLLYLSWYWGTPLGQTPVMDGAENLLIAESIADATLPTEPFYRAMLYPCVLSVFFIFGLTPDGSLLATQLLGLITHLCSTAIIFYLSLNLFNNRKNALMATVLFGFNPVLIYFAVDPLDVTFGILFFLIGLCGIIPLIKDSNATNLKSVCIGCFLTGLFWGLATLVRPHFIVVYLASPVILGFALLKWKASVRASIIILFVGGAVLCIGGLIQYFHSGSFRIMPWQGAYNLWAANESAANGKFFKQKILIEKSDSHVNPARVESIYLYLKETGTQPPVDIDAMNTYWRSKLFMSIAEEPGTWLSLMMRKVYYLLNNYEQYNNKTYILHKQLSPFLRWNPIGWGLLLIFCVGGCMLGFQEHLSAWRLLFMLFAVYAAGTILFYVSSRFRLPLVALLCLGSAGWPSLLQQWRLRNGLFKTGFISILVVTGGVSFSNLFEARDKSTFIQDYLLMANAAARGGLDDSAHQWAIAALELSPHRPDAIRVAVLSFYNLYIADTESKTGETWSDQLKRLRNHPNKDPILQFMEGIALWKIGHTEEAVHHWRKLKEGKQPVASAALGALLLSDHASENDLIDAKATAFEQMDPILRVALLRSDPSGDDPILNELREAENNVLLNQQLARIFPQQ
jgi:hypothetical protein